MEKRFYFAISFPNETRDFARQLAEELAEFVTRERVFYDEWYESELVGPSGDLELQARYSDACIIIPLFSTHYQKRWCRLEWDTIRGIMQNRLADRAVLPIRLDDTVIPGWSDVHFDIPLKGRTPEAIAALIVDAFDDRYPDLRSKAKVEEVDKNPTSACLPSAANSRIALNTDRASTADQVSHDPALVGFPQLPKIGQNNLWYSVNAGDTVFVFIHGILSDSRNCWLYSGAQGAVYWPDLILADPRFGKPAIYLAGYHTALDSGAYQISHCAEEILRGLKRDDQQGNHPVLDKSRIVFICHSTGGIVARYLLEKNSDDFRGKDVGLVLIASPSVGSTLADQFQWIINLYNNQLGLQLKWNNASLVDLDDRFKDLLERERSGRGKFKRLCGTEFYESRFVIHSKHVPLTTDMYVVGKGSAGRYFGSPKQLPATDHFSIVKPPDFEHPAHLYLYDFVKEYEFLPPVLEHGRAELPIRTQPHERATDTKLFPLAPRRLTTSNGDPANAWDRVKRVYLRVVVPIFVVFMIILLIWRLWPGQGQVNAQTSTSTVHHESSQGGSAALHDNAELAGPRLFQPVKDDQSLFRWTFKSQFDLTFRDSAALGLTSITPLRVPDNARQWFVYAREGIRKQDQVLMWAKGQYRIQCSLDISLGRPQRWRRENVDPVQMPHMFYKDVEVPNSSDCVLVPFSESDRVPNSGTPVPSGT